jgi:hypothetical protein
MRKQRLTYALILLAVYFISVAAIMSSLGIGFGIIADWSGTILLAALFTAAAMTFKNMAEAEKNKDDISAPGAATFIFAFSFRRYVTYDKKTGKRFFENYASSHRLMYALLAAAMLAFELVPFLLYINGAEFAALTDRAQAISLDIAALAVLYVLFLFPFLPGFIRMISEFEKVKEEDEN